MSLFKRLLLAATCSVALSACGTSSARMFAEPPRLAPRTESTDDLRSLPSPKQKLYAAVFAFQAQIKCPPASRSSGVSAP